MNRLKCLSFAAMMGEYGTESRYKPVQAHHGLFSPTHKESDMRNKGGKWAGFAGLPGALIPKPKKARKSPIGKTPEAVLQGQAEAYLDLLGVFYIRLPDSLMRVVFSSLSIPIWTKAEVSDCLKGLPDLTILKGGQYLAVELKREGCKMTTAQREVQKAIGTIQIERFEEFKRVVDEWLGKADLAPLKTL